MTLVTGGMTELKLLEKSLIQRMMLTWYRQHFGWSAATSLRSRAVITHSSLLCCRPQATVWVNRHSVLKSQAMATSGMAQFGVGASVWEIVKYNMVDSTKQRKVLNKRGCNATLQSGDRIGFWCNWGWSSSVMMIGGGGSNCSGAGHGIGVTAAKSPSFKIRETGRPEKEFGKHQWGGVTKQYALNLWIR